MRYTGRTPFLNTKTPEKSVQKGGKCPKNEIFAKISRVIFPYLRKGIFAQKRQNAKKKVSLHIEKEGLELYVIKYEYGFPIFENI